MLPPRLNSVMQRIIARLRHGLSNFRDDSGQSLVVLAFLMLGILGMVGLALDVGQFRLTSRQLQAQADAVAIAAAMQVSYCGATSDCAVMQSAAKSALVENGVATSTFLQNCATPANAGVVLTFNNPPCALGSVAKDPHYGDATYVEVVVSKQQPAVFATVLGTNAVNVLARAEAGVKSPTPCMYALDPTGANAFTVNLLAAVYSPKCGIVVESTNSAAFTCSLLASVTAYKIQVVGGYGSLLCAISPSPVTIKTPIPADPLAYLPTPALGSCGTSIVSPYSGATLTVNVLLAQTVVFNPGTYCGGIHVAFGGHATFQPGVYVLKSTFGSLGLTIDCGSTVSGSGVTFYNYGPTGPINFVFTSFLSGGVSLTAPVSGTYSGVLFFQDPGNTTAATLIGASSWNTVLQGAYYFPSAMVNVALGGVVNYEVLVAKDINVLALSDGVNPIQTGANNSNNFTSLSNGSPLQKTIPVLAQ